MIEVSFHDEIAELRLNRPPANALNHELLEALLAAYSDVLEQGARGLLLSGQPGMFSGGLDVPQLLGQSYQDISRFWSLFFQTNRSLAACPVPVVAAIAGHAPAGGAVFAAHCDYRIAANEPFKIGFNEVQVGLPLPATILFVFRDLVGSRVARLMGMQGQLIKMDVAHQIGLVDELVPADQVDARAIEFLQSLLTLPPVAMNSTRLQGKADLLAALENNEDVEVATQAWFSDETQAAMQRLVDSLKK